LKTACTGEVLGLIFFERRFAAILFGSTDAPEYRSDDDSLPEVHTVDSDNSEDGVGERMGEAHLDREESGDTADSGDDDYEHLISNDMDNLLDGAMKDLDKGERESSPDGNPTFAPPQVSPVENQTP